MWATPSLNACLEIVFLLSLASFYSMEKSVAPHEPFLIATGAETPRQRQQTLADLPELEWFGAELVDDTCTCGNCAECTQRVALKKRKAKERKARHRARKRAAGDLGEQTENTKARQEKRAGKRAAGDHGEQAKNTKARQEKRAANKTQWKDDLTCRELIKLFAHTTGARFTANSRLLEHVPVGTALHTRVEGEVERDIEDFVAVHPDTHARCRRECISLESF